MQGITRRRRAALVSALVVGACLPLAGCGGSSPAASTGPASSAPSSSSSNAEMSAYQSYLDANVDMLVSTTKVFTDAVRAGNVAAARRQYVIAHPCHERLESALGQFEELDKAIDARPENLKAINMVTGFHRLEKALWKDNSTAGMAAIATKLDTDVATLRDDVHKGEFTANQITAGAADVLTEVGERNAAQDEDAFSHVDLYDIAGNIDGVAKAMTLLGPTISARDPELAGRIQQSLTAAAASVAKFKRGTAYPDFTTVGRADRQAIAKALQDAAAQVHKAAPLMG